MAEPTNTPFPPSTPVPASTPRSTSPVQHHTSSSAATSPVSSRSTAHHHFHHGSTTTSVPPVPPFPDSTTPADTAPKPVVLHIGDPIKYNPQTYELFSSRFQVVRPSTPERQRDEFKRALAEKRWGNFHALFRPFWGTGGEMGQWDEELIALLPPSVKVFASAGAGFDWADVKLLGERGIVYCNSGLAAADAVADFAMALVISTFRHLPWCAAAATEPQQQEEIDGNDGLPSASPSPSPFQDCHANATGSSHLLRTQTLGLIGLGNIGLAIARRARLGFSMPVAYHDLVRKPEAEDKNPASGLGLGLIYHETTESLVANSDCVVLCTPAVVGAGPLITADLLRRFRHGSRFVNIARGTLVDEEALADALESGRLSSVALDVHADEPRVNPRLSKLSRSKAFLTCHNAGGTVETHVGFEELSMQNIMAVLGGGQPITPVNLPYLKR